MIKSFSSDLSTFCVAQTLLLWICVRNVSNMHVGTHFVCILKNFSRIHMLCPYRSGRVRAT